MSNNDFKSLFPVPFKQGFTTCSSINDPLITHVPLDDKSLNIHRSTKATPEHKTDTKSGHTSWQAFYPEGSINPQGKIKGGFGFYLSGPNGWKEKLKEAKEVLFGYRVLFMKDFQWVKGGKLPGICKSVYFSGDNR